LLKNFNQLIMKVITIIMQVIPQIDQQKSESQIFDCFQLIKGRVILVFAKHRSFFRKCRSFRVPLCSQSFRVPKWYEKECERHNRQ